MPYEKDDDEIGALWAKTSSNGNEYLSGTIEGVGRVVCFKQKPSEKGPAWRVLKSKEAPNRPRNAAPPVRHQNEIHGDDDRKYEDDY